jgi:hypothetical protein
MQKTYRRQRFCGGFETPEKENVPIVAIKHIGIKPFRVEFTTLAIKRLTDRLTLKLPMLNIIAPVVIPILTRI